MADEIITWYDAHAPALADPNHPLAERFMLEAAVSLPGIVPADADLDGCYSALNLQCLRLKQSQQVPEWSGTPYL